MRGNVAARRGRGLAFIDSLEADQRARVFSIVLVDSDRDDFVRSLRKAASSEKLFGRFFLSKPDFEFANFTVPELVDVAIGIMGEPSNQLAVDNIVRRMNGVADASSFFQELKVSGVTDPRKGRNWGIALMQHALDEPALPAGHLSAGQNRPIIEITKLLYRAGRAGYMRSIEKLRTDPSTGDLIPKED